MLAGQDVESGMYDIVIVGSGPAGLSAAIYARRSNRSAVVIEKAYEGTGQIAESGQVDNYLGLPGISGYDLGEAFRGHALQQGVTILEREVTSIARDAAGIYHVEATEAEPLQARTVIYAAGASPRRAGIPGEQEFAGRGVSYCAICDGAFYRGRCVAVLGGGDTALDDAAYLSGLAEHVYLIHRREQFRGAQATVERLRSRENVEFVLGAQVAAVHGTDKVTGVELLDGRHLAAHGVFVAYGSVPQTGILKGLVDLDPAGYVIADETGRTSLPGFYAAGDVRTKQLRQVVTAVADGASAATSAAAYLQEHAPA